eukprot:1427925-Rhodomonas_salina.3
MEHLSPNVIIGRRSRILTTFDIWFLNNAVVVGKASSLVVLTCSIFVGFVVLEVRVWGCRTTTYKACSNQASDSSEHDDEEHLPDLLSHDREEPVNKPVGFWQFRQTNEQQDISLVGKQTRNVIGMSLA